MAQRELRPLFVRGGRDGDVYLDELNRFPETDIYEVGAIEDGGDIVGASISFMDRRQKPVLIFQFTDEVPR